MPAPTSLSYSSRFLPMTPEEVRARGWNEVDIVFVTGDAYVDHPSFAMAILGRVLEKHGYRVAILSQPDWRSCEAWRTFGKPRLFFAISAGNMDSLINHYTANKKVRNDDAYSPGGRIGLRPDRATLPYCQRAREAYPGVPVIAGGVEASLRRLAHYDFWSDTVRRSILLDAKPDLLAYGMGEATILEIAKRLADGEPVTALRDMRGVAYRLGKSETVPPLAERLKPTSEAERDRTGDAYVELPSYEEVVASQDAFLAMTRTIHTNTNAFNARALVQRHAEQKVVVNPPTLPLNETEMDAAYDLPYTRRAHPSYKETIPAHEMIKDSVTIMRGCFGGCTFCSITAHQGRVIQSRSQKSIVNEVKKMTADPNFKGVISDVGGPTANMYQMRCTRPEIESRCRRLSCVFPTVCKLLGTDHKPTINILRAVRAVPGVKRVFVASGVRMDLAQLSPEYMQELSEHHVGGLLKVAPEHTDPAVLARMKKPSIDNFSVFAKEFDKASKRVGKKQHLVPYFISSHPGSDLNAMIDLALYLKRNGYRPDQVQDFIPAPFDIATAMYYTGRDPFTGDAVPVAKGLRERRLQRALLQFFKPENYFEVRKALEEAGRTDLIGFGCDSLIAPTAPKAALDARRERALREMDRYVHQPKVPGAVVAAKSGYRPDRAQAGRRERTPH